MSVETALFFESVEEIYSRVFRQLRPRSPLPEVVVRYRKYASANSRIRLSSGMLAVDISDLLEDAPAPIQEALATILISKLFRRPPEQSALARYRRYLDRAEMRRMLARTKQERGRKSIRDPKGNHFDLIDIFERLNEKYFFGLMARPTLGWSVRSSRTTLGHYDPSHHVIVITSAMDNAAVNPLIVEFVMFHEMLHLRFPTECRGARRCVHTAAFKKAEREFQEFDQAKQELRMFVERLY